MRGLNYSGMVVDTEKPHLGGYFPDGDPSSYCPELWSWLIAELRVSSVLDVGCGSGQALRYFLEHGCTGLGIDGLPPRSDLPILAHDYTTGPWPPVSTAEVGLYGGQNASFDLCWSCEFVEHVEERYLPNFLASFACADLVLMTHAVPGQLGHHHANCRIDEYWLGVMAAEGFRHDRELTLRTRELAGQGYYSWSGLAFERYE